MVMRKLQDIHAEIDAAAKAYVAQRPADPQARLLAEAAAAKLKARPLSAWRSKAPNATNAAFSGMVHALQLAAMPPEERARREAHWAEAQAAAEAKREKARAARQRRRLADLPPVEEAFRRTARKVKKDKADIVWKVEQLAAVVDVVPPEAVDRLVAELEAAAAALSGSATLLKQKRDAAMRPADPQARARARDSPAASAH